jgi:Tfp pilus assembly protein PilF
VSLAVELIKAGQIDDAKKVLKVAVQQDPQLSAVILDHPGLEEVWWP